MASVIVWRMFPILPAAFGGFLRAGETVTVEFSCSRADMACYGIQGLGQFRVCSGENRTLSWYLLLQQPVTSFMSWTGIQCL